MDIGKSLGYMFDDENWVNKVLIGGLIGLVPVLNLALTGYALRTLKNVAAGSTRPLPDWDDLGNDWLKGLLATVAGMIYALPLLITVLPLFVLSFTASLGEGAEGINALMGLGTVGLWCLAIPYCFLVAAWMPAAMANYALAGDFGAFFRFGQIWALIQRNAGNYALLVIIYVVVGQVASWVGALVFVVGAAFTGFWTLLVLGHLLGQFVREDPGLPTPVA